MEIKFEQWHANGNDFVIVNLCALPAPTPVNVIATPEVTSCLLGNS